MIDFLELFRHSRLARGESAFGGEGGNPSHADPIDPIGRSLLKQLLIAMLSASILLGMATPLLADGAPPTPPAAGTAPTTAPTTPTPAPASDSIQLSNPLGTTSLHVMVGRIIRGLTGIVGSIALLMFVWGGIRWIAAGGSEENVKAAKKRIANATIGLLLIFFAYTIISAFLSLF